jgi:hypothetical protein
MVPFYCNHTATVNEHHNKHLFCNLVNSTGATCIMYVHEFKFGNQRKQTKNIFLFIISKEGKLSNSDKTFASFVVCNTGRSHRIIITRQPLSRKKNKRLKSETLKTSKNVKSISK